MEWAPKWVPHAKGTWPDPVAGEPLDVQLRCDVCGQTHRVQCLQNNPRAHVQRWALVHLHRDPLKVDPVFGDVSKPR